MGLDLIATLVLLAASGGTPSVPAPAALPDDYPRNPSVDVLHYVFRIGLSDATDRIEGEATVRVRFRDAGVEALRLDLVGASPGLEGGMTVREVTGPAGPLAFRHDGDVLRVELAEPSRADATAEVRVAYAGTPRTGLLVGPNRHGHRTFFSDNWPNKARHWLPTVDHPYDKATTEMVVTAPAHYQVVSNGLLVEETDLPGGMRRTWWRQSVPMATWLNAVAVSPFAVDHREPWQGRPIQTWVYPEDRDTGFDVFAGPTRPALQFFSERVGPYAYEKVANIQAASVGGGMESASAIFYGEESATGARPQRWREVIVHELAHQWFGNAVTELDWDEVWLSEGFATYFTLLFFEHADGREAFVDGLVAARDLVRPFYAENPDYEVVHDDLTDMSQVVTYPGTYQKGAWVLHMLRRRVGDAAFWDGIRLYYGRHMNGNATVADFRRAMEETSGQELGPFLDQWLRRGGWPSVTGRWSWDAAAGEVVVELEQRVSGSGGPMRLPVEVGLHVPGRERPVVTTVDLDGPHASVRIPSAVEPDDVSLDPETWLLADTSMERDAR